ncbi:helix-turn-helix domain-containing protein [Pseudothauera rhizosphaerae]|uniref:helix-turn-helix domain-containing protein n=1 Tax=Pseudothauera rhizosphaerae TaxID=2565932 RepID=UPI001454E29B|nr:AraC family transcriptional regulator [Pseudothauera rhizosphaerae]
MSERRGRAPQIVLSGALHAQVVAGGNTAYRIAPDLDAEVPVLHGVCHGAHLRPGLSIHCADVRDLHDLSIQTLQGENLYLAVLLDGQVDVSFGPCRIGLGATRASRVRKPEAAAAFATLREPELFVRRARRGSHERKVGITFSREWLAAACPESDAGFAGPHPLFDRHLAVGRWTPTPRAVALAEQLVHPPELPPLLRGLYLESRSVELVAEALCQLSDAASTSPALRPRERRRIVEVRELLDSGAAEGLALDQIARRAGTNVCTMQRHFRTAFGTTVFEYERQRRLLRARQALEQEGRSVGEAADLAGYTSAANFATAFKRHFGLTPRQCRQGF